MVDGFTLTITSGGILTLVGLWIRSLNMARKVGSIENKFESYDKKIDAVQDRAAERLGAHRQYVDAKFEASDERNDRLENKIDKMDNKIDQLLMMGRNHS
jgi:hypothetical protein